METQKSDLSWKDGGVPVSNRFDDPYYSLENGLAETRYVFLQGNRLPERLCDGFHVAELGFGTGLNLLALAELAAKSGAQIHFTSFEAFPLSAAQTAQALAAFPETAPYAPPLLAALEAGQSQFQMPGLTVELVLGDARETLPQWGGSADAWFLDGFSPAKNPELWGAELLAEVGRHTAQTGTCATYTAAGFVRQGLAAAGFTVERIPGFGRKRHMTVGQMP
ncbi:MAG: tRNA (5-methylaminomethyl-2-thiouridine)(34)-methyltransferase MnmD [Mangrovicoccus sp.]